MYKIFEKVRNVIKETIKNYQVELTGGKSFANVKIQRSIFQGDTLTYLGSAHWWIKFTK